MCPFGAVGGLAVLHSLPRLPLVYTAVVAVADAAEAEEVVEGLAALLVMAGRPMDCCLADFADTDGLAHPAGSSLLGLTFCCYAPVYSGVFSSYSQCWKSGEDSLSS